MRDTIADRMIQTAMLQPTFDLDDYISVLKEMEHYLYTQSKNSEASVHKLNKALLTLKQFSDAVDGDIEVEVSNLAVKRCISRIKELMKQEQSMKKKLEAIRTYLDLLGADDAYWEEVTARIEDV